MSIPRQTTSITRLALPALIMLLPPRTLQSPCAAAAQDATATASVGELRIMTRRDGTIDSATRVKIRFAPEAYNGSVKVADVLHRIGPVKQGQLLARLEATELERSARAARESLHDAERSLELAQQDRQIMLEQHKLALERSEWAAVSAQHAYEMFQKAESENMLKSAELGVQGQENGLSNQKEELAQLEQMYRGTELSGETKEIVLERARRSVRMSEQYLDIARDNLQLTRDYRHPDREREITQQQRWTATDLELLRISQRLADIRSEASIQNAERALRDARDRAEKAERDLELVEIKAPADGVITRIDLQPGDSVGGGAVVCELVDPDHLIATFAAKEDDLRIVAPGAKVRIAMPAFGEVSLNGEVKELADIGASGPDGATFPARIQIDGSHDLLRAGQKCAVHAEKVITDVLRVPAKALTSRDDRSFVNVIDAGGEKREVEVTIGARGEDMVQIVSGLKAGDVVAIPTEKPADGGQ